MIPNAIMIASTMMFVAFDCHLVAAAEERLQQKAALNQIVSFLYADYSR
jgi:hypothetical protein